MNILISSAGRRVVLVREFRKALRSLRLKGQVVAVDISNTAPALYAADKGMVVPPVRDRAFIDALILILKMETIGLVVPTIDPELPVYAHWKEEIRGQTGALVAISEKEVIDTCNDKLAFFSFLRNLGIPTPRTYTKEEALETNPGFPLFAKPRYGFASVNTCRVEGRGELEYLARKHTDLIFQEFTQGKEYTIDLLSDFRGRVLSIVPRERIEVRAGEVTRSRTEKNPIILEMSKRIAESLGSLGPITLQCILSGETPIFFEINPRVGGGLPASIAAGANTPKKLIQLALGKSLRPSIGRFRDNHYMLRYDDAIYRKTLIQGGIDVWRK